MISLEINMSIYKYAQALFDVSNQRDAIDEVLHDYETFTHALEQNEEWLSVMNSTQIKRDEKRKLIQALSDFHPVFLQFLFTLAENRHLSEYYRIFEQFRMLARREQKVAFVRVVSAKPLSVEQFRLIREELHAWIIDKEIEIEMIIDKRLLGGVRIYYEGQTIDRSFYSELNELKATL